MEITTCRVSSDTLRIVAHGRVVTATVSGFLGLPESLGAIAQVRHAARRDGVCGVVVDLRGAALALSVPQYVETLRFALASPIVLPVAFVVGGGLMVLSGAHARLMSRRGLRRRFFSSVPEAVRWASRATHRETPPSLFP